MARGRTSGLALALGVATGSFLWATLTVAGLSTLLATYAAALTVIKIIGGCFLLWLAYKSFCAAAAPGDSRAPAPARPRRGGDYWRGLTIQMTNPKAALAWIAIISLGLRADAPLWVGVAIVGGTALLSTLIHCTYAVAFSTPTVARLYGKARRWLHAALGAFFGFAGLKLLVDRA